MYYTFSADVLVVYSSNISQRGQHVQRHSHTYVHTHLIGQTCHLFSPPHTYIFIHARPSRLHTHAPHIHPPFYSFTHTNASIPPTHPNYSPLRKLPFFTHSPRPIYRHSSPSSQSKKSVNFEALHTVPRASGSKGTPVSRRAASRTPPYPLGAPYRWLRQPASTLEKTQCPGLALAPGSTPFRTRSGGPRSTRPTLRFLGDGSKRANGACRDHVFRSPRLADGLAFLCFSINMIVEVLQQTDKPNE